MIQIFSSWSRVTVVLMIALIGLWGVVLFGEAAAGSEQEGSAPAAQRLSDEFAEFWECGWAGCKGWKGVGSLPDTSELPDDLIRFMASCWDMTVQGYRIGEYNPFWSEVAEAVWGEKKHASVRSAGENVAAFFFSDPEAVGHILIRVVDRNGRLVAERSVPMQGNSLSGGCLIPPALSDDGRLLLFYDAPFQRVVNGRLNERPGPGSDHILNLASGELIKLSYSKGEASSRRGRRTYSPQGTYLAAYGPPYREIRMHDGNGRLLWTVQFSDKEDATAIVFSNDETRMAVIVCHRMSTGDEPAPREPDQYYLAMMSIQGHEFARVSFPRSHFTTPGSIRVSEDDRYVCVGVRAHGEGPCVFLSADGLMPLAVSSERQLKAIGGGDQ